jgi:hypothetical protein
MFWLVINNTQKNELKMGPLLSTGKSITSDLE